MNDLFSSAAIAQNQSPTAEGNGSRGGASGTGVPSPTSTVPVHLLVEQRIRFTCDVCERIWSVTAGHYDKFQCGGCNKIYWAIRPKRFGPLVAYPWPGTPEMLAFKQAGLTANQR